MNIAMIGQKGIPAELGGIERHVEELSQRLVQAGHPVTVFSRAWYTGLQSDAIQNGITITHTPSLRTKHLDTITATFLATIAAMRGNFDILHFHGVGPALLAWLPRLFTPNKGVIVTFHCIDRKHGKWGPVARLVLRIGEWAATRFAHTTIAVSHTIHQYVRDVYDREAEYIPSGVPLFERATTTTTLTKFNLVPGRYVVALSRLVPHKGIHYLLGAWQNLRKNKPELVRDYQLVIVGDGHYTDAYVSMLKNSVSPTDGIIFTGTQTGQPLAELMSHAHSLVHPSNNEGLPLTVLEAMSYRLPVLASDIREHRDIGLTPDNLFTRASVPDLEKKLEEFLTMSPEMRAHRGTINRAMVEAHFAWEDTVNATIASYFHTLAAAKPLGSSSVA